MNRHISGPECIDNLKLEPLNESPERQLDQLLSKAAFVRSASLTAKHGGEGLQ
jgi:hypothetical protein